MCSRYPKKQLKYILLSSFAKFDVKKIVFVMTHCRCVNSQDVAEELKVAANRNKFSTTKNPTFVCYTVY